MHISKLVLLFAVALSSGCLTVDNDDGPVLSIELYWDERLDRSGFAGASCDRAGVEMMEWALYDADEWEADPASAEPIAGRAEPCADAIDVLEPEPGGYVLDIQGFDEDEDERWSIVCEGLFVLRFDVGFECDIHGGS